jgi:hypothetical protein
MFRRLFLGLFEGAFLGALLVFAIVRGAGWSSLPLWMALVASGVLGAVIGLVAGKPIWREGAKIEAGLKSFFGALLGVGALYAMQRWVPLPALPMAIPGVEHGPVPLAYLPLVGITLAMLFELDDTPETKDGKTGRARVEALPGRNVRVESDEDDVAEDLPPAASRRGAKR